MNGITDSFFRIGDVVQVKHQGTNQSGTYSFDPLHTTRIHQNDTFWGVFALFSRPSTFGKSEFCAAVHPFLPLAYVPTAGENVYGNRWYVLWSKLSFLVINSNVRRVALLPICLTSNCQPSTTRARINHSEDCNPLKGVPFFLLTMKERYPPRKG